jgi:hypothetical protein
MKGVTACPEHRRVALMSHDRHDLSHRVFAQHASLTFVPSEMGWSILVLLLSILGVALGMSAQTVIYAVFLRNTHRLQDNVRVASQTVRVRASRPCLPAQTQHLRKSGIKFRKERD